MVFEMDSTKPSEAAGGGAKSSVTPGSESTADHRDTLMRLTASVHTNQANLIAMCAKEEE